ncbi:MAG: glycosyltransferase family 2 protein [Patescibacteria group bacterium]|nr:glycosyltransferase family 2 protein [Patescibacteria group bacterium]
MTVTRQKNKIDVSIVIVSHKNASVLKLCLDALEKNIGREIKGEIIVVDSETQEEVRDLVLEDYPKVRFIPFFRNVGFARALNKGIKSARGEMILALNPDIVVKRRAVEIMHRYMKKHAEAGIAGPMLLNFNGSYQASCFRFYTPATVIYRRTFLGESVGKKALKSFVISPKGEKPQRIKGWLMGSALMLRADNLAKVGLMDERYFMYFEDVDWCRRFFEAGYKIVYVPQAKMFHYHSKMSASKSIFSLFFNKMTFVHLLSGLKYFIKFKGWKIKEKNGA